MGAHEEQKLWLQLPCHPADLWNGQELQFLARRECEAPVIPVTCAEENVIFRGASSLDVKTRMSHCSLCCSV